MSDTDIVTRLCDGCVYLPATAAGMSSGGVDEGATDDLMAKAAAEITALRSALRECADDLAGEIDARCPPAFTAYEGERRKYDRDMAPVLRARALLEGKS